MTKVEQAKSTIDGIFGDLIYRTKDAEDTIKMLSEHKESLLTLLRYLAEKEGAAPIVPTIPFSAGIYEELMYVSDRWTASSRVGWLIGVVNDYDKRMEKTKKKKDNYEYGA